MLSKKKECDELEFLFKVNLCFITTWSVSVLDGNLLSRVSSVGIAVRIQKGNR